MKVPVSMVPSGGVGAGIAAIILLGIIVFAAKAIAPQPQPPRR